MHSVMNSKNTYKADTPTIPYSSIHLFDFDSFRQNIVPICIILILISTSIYSIFLFNKKKDLLQSRGGIILQLLFFAHVFAIGIPNLLTIGIVNSKDMNIFCIPRSTYLYVTDFLCNSILILILAKACYMKTKSLNWDMTNSIGYFIGLFFIALCSTTFLIVVIEPSMQRTPFRYINICAIESIDYFRMDIKNPLNFVLLYISYLMLYKIKIWGVKQEYLNLLVLILVYLGLKGLHHVAHPTCRFREELIENLFKTSFFNVNCSIFLWFFDDAEELFKSVKNNELEYMVNWNDSFKKQYKSFLEYNFKIDELDFLENALEKNMKNYASFFKNLGKGN